MSQSPGYQKLLQLENVGTYLAINTNSSPPADSLFVTGKPLSVTDQIWICLNFTDVSNSITQLAADRAAKVVLFDQTTYYGLVASVQHGTPG